LIRWNTGDDEKHLSRSDVLEICAELGFEWQENRIADSAGQTVGLVKYEGHY
jgi:hypothetical protein